MNEKLLIVERIVLESISRKNRNIVELSNDTGLSVSLLNNILPTFIMKNLVIYNNGVYCINNEMKNLWINEINSKDSLKCEVKELFTNLVNHYFEEEKAAATVELKVKKIWMTPYEKKLLRMHLNNLNEFVSNIEKENKKDQNFKTKEQEIIVWSVSDYEGVINSFLEAV